MDYIVIKNDDNIEIEKFETFNEKNGNIFQSIKWLKANNFDNYSIVIGKENDIICIAGVFIKIYNLENDEICIYFPKGPIVVKQDYDILNNFFEYVENYAKNNKMSLIRYEPNFEKKEGLIIEKVLKKREYIVTNPKFWNYNWTINLEKTNIDLYLKSLKPKTRYNICYSMKKGVQVLIDNSEDSVKKFYDLLLVTSNRDGFETKNFEQYYNLFNFFGENVKLFWTYIGDFLLSAAILIIYGDTAYYMYGASSNKNRNLQSTYLLQYSMIEYSIIKKCKKYYMGGVGYKNNGNDYFCEGLLEFKRKFQGDLIENLCCYEKRIRSD